VASGKQSLTTDQLGQLYPDLSPERRAVIASLPGETQERTLDNLRGNTGQDETNRRFDISQTNADRRLQEGFNRRDVQEDQRRQAQNKRQEASLRSEHQRNAKDYITRRNNFNTLEAAAGGTAIDDHALIFSYLKVLDPRSTVREGEFAAVRDTTGLPDRVKNYLNQIWQGNKLTAKQRSEILSQSAAQFEVATRSQNQLDDEYRRLAVGQDLDPSRVVLDFVTPKKSHATTFDKLPDPATVKDKTFREPTTGRRVKSDGTKYWPVK
jgi:hypothetical protein